MSNHLFVMCCVVLLIRQIDALTQTEILFQLRLAWLTGDVYTILIIFSKRMHININDINILS
jgi:hypothetical protein